MEMSAQRTVTVYTPVKDSLTKRDLIRHNYCPVLELYNAKDTSLIGTYYNRQFDLEPKGQRYFLRVFVLDVTADNKIGGESDDYEEEWITLEGNDIPDDVVEYTMPTVFLHRPMKRKLDEVTVTSSRIMFYHRGDTLVYNASAFVLSEGSMLDALIAQLPGTSIDSNGVISCNGRRIDNLLLNGKDLFNGNHELMLENLPAYTVKNVAVYDKKGRTSELMGADAGDSQHVMDVRLKRQFQQGILANMEAGYGTHDRYLGRLFGLWYTENASVSVHAAFNNLSDRNEPGQYDPTWNKDMMEQGVSTHRLGGLTYQIQNDDNSREARGDLRIAYSDQLRTTESVTDFFLPDRTAHTHGWSDMDDRSLSVTSGHHWFSRLGPRVNLTVEPQFSYRKRKKTGNSISGIFNEAVADLSRSRLEAIYSGADEVLSDILVNRNRYEELTNGHSVTGKLLMASDVRFVGNNMWHIWAKGDMTTEWMTGFRFRR